MGAVPAPALVPTIVGKKYALNPLTRVALNRGFASIAFTPQLNQSAFMDESDLHIRPATEGDIPRLLDLYQHLNPGDDRPEIAVANEAFARFLTYPGSAIFLGERDNVLVASCALVVIPNLTRGARPYGLIENVVTHRDHRQRGYGRQVLDAASAAAWTSGCYKVMLLTGSKQPEVLEFYKRAGFEQTKTGFQKRRIPIRSEP